MAFAHTYVLLSLDFDDIDNTPMAKRTHVLSAFAHTYVLLSPDFDDTDHTWLGILNFPSLALQYLKGHMSFGLWAGQGNLRGILGRTTTLTRVVYEAKNC